MSSMVSALVNRSIQVSISSAEAAWMRASCSADSGPKRAASRRVRTWAAPSARPWARLCSTVVAMCASFASGPRPAKNHRLPETSAAEDAFELFCGAGGTVLAAQTIGEHRRTSTCGSGQCCSERGTDRGCAARTSGLGERYRCSGHPELTHPAGEERLVHHHRDRHLRGAGTECLRDGAGPAVVHHRRHLAEEELVRGTVDGEQVLAPDALLRPGSALDDHPEPGLPGGLHGVLHPGAHL